jgi:ATP-binding cassette subfamily B protein
MAAAHRRRLTLFERTEASLHRKFRMRLWKQDQTLVASQVALITVSYLSYLHGLSIGGIVMSAALMARIYGNIWRYGEFQWVLNHSSEALKELVELFEMEPTIKPPADPKWPAQVEGRIAVEDVSFTYPGATSEALSDIDLTIEPGTTVAFVGPSGGGKSTLARLIQHQYEPSAGEIKVDGIPLQDYDDLKYRRKMLGSVPQEPGLFDRTIELNIGMVQPGATAEDIRRAAREASANEFIDDLPNGYETVVGERGVTLSGGQRQRVALARALLRRPPILVLDEPTSALDAVSQLAVKQTLEKLAASRHSTIIIIAHRFSTIEMADVVVVMKAGRIVEIGTHAELQRKNGLYQRLRSLEGLHD